MSIEQWDLAAEQYTAGQEQSEFANLNKQIVIKRFSNLQNKTVLDLGCGYGWYTDYFKKIGATVIGCDGSSKMIYFAKNKYANIEFNEVDFCKQLPYDDNRFDLVFCNQVLMDLADIPHLIKEVNRVMKNNGIFYMSIVHPAFYDCHWGQDDTGFCKTKIMERYLSEYSFDNEFWGETIHYHRTISHYINIIIGSGFVLKCLNEPKSYDGTIKSDEFPLFLFAEFEKANSVK